MVVYGFNNELYERRIDNSIFLVLIFCYAHILFMWVSNIFFSPSS